MKRKTKRIKVQDKTKEIKANEDRRKQLVESNKLNKKDFNINRNSIPLKEQKKITNFMKKDILNLRIEKNNPNNNLSTKGKE